VLRFASYAVTHPVTAEPYATLLSEPQTLHTRQGAKDYTSPLGRAVKD